MKNKIDGFVYGCLCLCTLGFAALLRIIITKAIDEAEITLAK